MSTTLQSLAAWRENLASQRREVVSGLLSSIGLPGLPSLVRRACHMSQCIQSSHCLMMPAGWLCGSCGAGAARWLGTAASLRTPTDLQPRPPCSLRATSSLSAGWALWRRRRCRRGRRRDALRWASFRPGSEPAKRGRLRESSVVCAAGARGHRPTKAPPGVLSMVFQGTCRLCSPMRNPCGHLRGEIGPGWVLPIAPRIHPPPPLQAAP